ncbi:hypothetical protein RvY_06363-2 [Ramazzottius varieornatus]|uniref:Uncharacterized protein n=1 Tax=Ramazzottius varieornatus TaxID=947166 RepID=A0A1D1UYB8_RAMVA|nr:hypothetical protein RvY_06363-2 [Ramazzottius varieornatus]
MPLANGVLRPCGHLCPERVRNLVRSQWGVESHITNEAWNLPSGAEQADDETAALASSDSAFISSMLQQNGISIPIVHTQLIFRQRNQPDVGIVQENLHDGQ